MFYINDFHFQTNQFQFVEHFNDFLSIRNHSPPAGNAVKFYSKKIGNNKKQSCIHNQLIILKKFFYNHLLSIQFGRKEIISFGFFSEFANTNCPIT